MIRNLLSSIFSRDSSLSDRIIAIFFALLAIALIGCLTLTGYLLVDRAGLSTTHTETTVVEAKWTVPAHYTTVAVTVGDVVVPTLSHHPEEYMLRFQIRSQDTDIAVYRETYNRVNVGDSIRVDYGSGRLSGSFVTIQVHPLP